MAAPHIPNLDELRGSRGGRPPRRGRPAVAGMERVANDKIIQGTDQDASTSRMSAVELGYLKDHFAKAFVPLESGSVTRKYPIINRGTYVRTTTIDRLVEAFLSSDSPTEKQIISLGAGSDTRFFRLQDKLPCVSNGYVYHELDFPSNTANKIRIITASPSVCQYIPGALDISADGSTLRSSNYFIQPIDLRTLTGITAEDQTNAVQELSHINASAPTLLISECCLVYLEPTAADAVLNFFTSLLRSALGIVIYEPINPFDPFGEVMVSNLAARGIVLQTLQKYHSLTVQKSRLLNHGFEDVDFADVDWIWENWIDEEEKRRVAGLEMVDEVEEWQLLARHYCVVWGRRGKMDQAWGKWRELHGR